jgi:hypothetical protein
MVWPGNSRFEGFLGMTQMGSILHIAQQKSQFPTARHTIEHGAEQPGKARVLPRNRTFNVTNKAQQPTV